MPAMSASYPHPVIAREGWPFLAAAVGLAVASGWLIGWWSAPLWLAVLFVLQFFRDPPRQAPGGSESRGGTWRQRLRHQHGDCHAAASCLSPISADRF